ncbi:MAG: 2-isopropylmalate synthase, partial [Spirochaetes bacterium]
NKGFKKREERGSKLWEVPYLPINPKDVGRSYQSIIRINSQSGKGGVAYLMDSEFGYKLPKAMQVEFSRVIQGVTEESGSEISSRAIWESFKSEYLEIKTPYELKHIKISMDSDSDNDAAQEVTLVSGLLSYKGRDIKFSSEGNGPIDAFIKGLNSTLSEPVKLKSYDEHNIDGGSDSSAVSYISLRQEKGSVKYGVGTDSNISMASIKAIVSALNRLSQ